MPDAIRGRLITLEGIDGAGKSTHLPWLGELLSQDGKPVWITREPGGTPLGERLRELLLREPMAHVTEALLMFAARREHCEREIWPRLEQGTWVLCDRFTDATFAYQGGGRGIPAERVAMAEKLATGGLLPELTLLFDLPAGAARKRGKSPKRAARGAVDRLDAEELAFYELVRRGFLDRAAADPRRFRNVDSSGDKEATAAAVRATLQPLVDAETARASPGARA